MIFFVGNDGTIIKSFHEYVYQGSANTNTIYLIAPFAVNSQVTVAFQLPNGTWTSPVAMTQQQALQNIVNKETGQTYAGWTYALPNNITQNFGVLTVQFFFYSASAGVITATSSAKLTVAKGVPSILPETPSEDVYEAILSNIAALQEQLNNGTFVARSIYAWNSTYTYGANEITFYPSIGDYGAFVQSLQTGNTNHQPYDSDGTLNSTWWKEVVNFNTITEDFFDEIKEQADLATTAAQNAATSEASAAQSASAAAASESAAETAATTATGAAASAEKDAETASTSANAAAASANASAASASQANNSAIAANNSAIAAANSAAQIEDMKTTFALKDESASSLEVSLNNATFVLTMTLKDVNGNTLSTQTVDFPIESMVVGISYNEATKTLIFQLQSGSTIEVPIDDIVDGLATQTALDNVINGTTPVAKATAADTAGQVDNALTVVTDGVSQSYNGSAPLTVKINTTSSTDPESVHFTSQTLNDSQQTQARENIGAASKNNLDKALYNLAPTDTVVTDSDDTVTVTRNRDGVTYTETLPADVPLNQLDANMSDIVRDEVEKTLNLFNYKNTIDGYLLDGNGGTPKNSLYCISDYIHIDAGDYTLSFDMEDYVFIDRYNERMNFISSIIMGGVGHKFNFTLTSSCYIRFSCLIERKYRAMLNKGPQYPYQPYNGAIVHEKQLDDALEDYPTNDELNTKLEDYLPLTGGTINGTINATGQVQEDGERVYSPNNPQTTIAHADNATKATQDSDGNTIIDTYQKVHHLYEHKISLRKDNGTSRVYAYLTWISNKEDGYTRNEFCNELLNAGYTETTYPYPATGYNTDEAVNYTILGVSAASSTSIRFLTSDGSYVSFDAAQTGGSDSIIDENPRKIF